MILKIFLFGRRSVSKHDVWIIFLNNMHGSFSIKY